jgi:F-type H+-transporting ATPase subunit epsilon
MANNFLLEIVTPDRSFFEGEVELVRVRTTEGDVAILFDHEPLVTPVTIGAIKINTKNEKKYAACSTGFLSVSDKKVTIITDAAEWSNEIDVERAKQALEKAQQKLQSKDPDHESEILLTKAAVMRATNRLKVSGL